MTHLVPEKRLDRNGRLVTKHVRADAVAAPQRSSLPAPSPGGTAPKRGREKAFKPRVNQLEQYIQSHRLIHFKSDAPLATDEERADYSSHTSFYANDVEFYDVLSATTSTGNALELMMKGVRTAEQAREYLSTHGADHLIADRSELTQEALKRNISPHNFITAYEKLTPEERESEFLLDAIEFMGTSLNEGLNGSLKNDIIKGEIAYADIKALGITKLKSHSRGSALSSVLWNLNKGGTDYTIEDIRELLDRAIAEKATHSLLTFAADTLHYDGPENLRKIKSLDALDTEHYSYVRSDQASAHDGKTRQHVYALMTYAAQVKAHISRGLFGKSVFLTDDFYEAGIPVEIAADVINAGGTVPQAKAIHEEGIENSLSGGWL